jgi:hypothetical protein
MVWRKEKGERREEHSLSSLQFEKLKKWLG